MADREKVLYHQEKLVADNRQVVEAFDSGLISHAGDGPILNEEETATSRARAVELLKKSEEDLEEMKKMFGRN